MSIYFSANFIVFSLERFFDTRIKFIYIELGEFVKTFFINTNIIHNSSYFDI